MTGYNSCVHIQNFPHTVKSNYEEISLPTCGQMKKAFRNEQYKVDPHM